MSQDLLLILAIILPCTLAEPVKKPTCSGFSENAEFKEQDAVGVWHLLRPENGKYAGEAKCLQFTTVDEKERKDIEDRVGKYVPDINWQAVTLKMQIPCTNNTQDRSQAYYLERLDGVGSYMTLDLIPSQSEKLKASDIHRHPMRLKSISGHLAMMDCKENFVFLMAKQPQAPNTKLDDHLTQIMKDYWVED